MKIKSLQFGEIQFDENNIINFRDGIIGFEEQKKYVLLREEQGIFLWLTSIDEPEFVFPVFGIKPLVEDYPQKENYDAFGIVKLNKDPSRITINLKAPVYINQQTKEGFQKILDEERFPIDYILFEKN